MATITSAETKDETLFFLEVDVNFPSFGRFLNMRTPLERPFKIQNACLEETIKVSELFPIGHNQSTARYWP